MATQQEIHNLKAYLVEDLYKGVRAQQAIDRSFYNDTFSVPELIQIERIQRTGRASRMIDSPAENIITSNPQVTRKPHKESQTSKDSALAVSTELNRWLSIWKRSNPNPIKQFVKNLLLTGEAYFHPIHNEKWVTGNKIRKGAPILLLVPDPYNIYADPTEDENGVPERVVVWYPRKPSIIKTLYPNWANPEGKKLEDDSVTIDWLEHWDTDQIYFEADGQVLHNVKNRYGFPPYVHALSGFGTTSPEGRLEDLIVGRLRKSRDRLRRECAIVSDIDASFHLFANRNIDVQPTDERFEVPEDFAQNYQMGAGKIHELPFGIAVTHSEQLLPEPQLFQYYRDIVTEFELEDPLVMSGIAMGGSGRQQDMTYVAAMRRYDTIVENTEYALATALGMALKMCEQIPTLCPTEYGMKKDDIGKYYDVTVALKADDPIEADRKATLGSRLYGEGQIDLETNLTKYQLYTQDEADEIISNILVDRVTFQSPEVAELMGLKLAEKAGLADDLEILKQRRMQLESQQKTLGQMPPPSTQARQARGEVGSPMGREMIDEALRQRGQRRPPEGYVQR